MRSDPVGACLGGEMGRAHRVRMSASAGVADRRHVIDIDTESELARTGAMVMDVHIWSFFRLDKTFKLRCAAAGPRDPPPS
jgi:hypothetical protein